MIGMWSVLKFVLVLIPTNRGLPRRVATHSPGKNLLFSTKANAPSWWWTNIRKRTSFIEPYQLLDNLFHKLSEGQLGVLIMQVFDQLGDDLSVRFRFKGESLLFQKLFDVFVVGDNAVVHHNELVVWIRTLRVRIEVWWSPVCCPSSVSNAHVEIECIV